MAATVTARPLPGLAERGKRWLRLSWPRQVAMVVSAVSLVLALAAA